MTLVTLGFLDNDLVFKVKHISHPYNFEVKILHNKREKVYIFSLLYYNLIKIYLIKGKINGRKDNSIPY
jgi:hypothetical protein